MKLITTTTLIALMATSLMAEHAFLNDDNPTFTKREIHSLKLAKKWMKNGVKSIKGKDGSITFIYGATMPSIVVAPLRFADIQLQPGEVIREIQLGDTVRWQVTPSISGTAPTEVSHVIVKPTDVGLTTTLAIMTNRRAYHLNLKSSKKKYMPIVNFHYTDEIDNKWAAYKGYMNKQKEANQFSVDAGAKIRNIDTLNFNYKIRGNASWKPVRVYNDGVKTYIQMPKTMKFKEAPILMVLDKHSNKKLVNYRLKNDRFIVDKLFREAVLIVGVGSDQEKIIIQRSNRKMRSNALDILKSIDEEY